MRRYILRKVEKLLRERIEAVDLRAQMEATLLGFDYQCKAFTLSNQESLNWKKHNFPAYLSWLKATPPPEWTDQDEADYRAMLKLKGKPETLRAFVKRTGQDVSPAVMRMVEETIDIDLEYDRAQAAKRHKENELYDTYHAGEIDSDTFSTAILAIYHGGA